MHSMQLKNGKYITSVDHAYPKASKQRSEIAGSDSNSSHAIKQASYSCALDSRIILVAPESYS